MNEGEEIKVNKIEMLDRETQPPKRYTPASIIKELEKRGLGTKATRSDIVETLFKRNYVSDTSIQATRLGIDLIDVLLKHSPKIVEEELTRHFEQEMQLIFKSKKHEQEVLDEAKVVLTKILKEFKEKEKEIGTALEEANRLTEEEQNTLGPCPVCKTGTLVMKRGRFGMFIACKRYPDCTATFKLPSYGTIKTLDKVCEHCGFPIIKVIKKRSAQEICINPECPGKKLSAEDQKIADAVEKEEKACPKCGEGKIVLRRSVYGTFLGCSNYPKCRYIEKLNSDDSSKPSKRFKSSKSSKSKKRSSSKSSKKS